MTTMTTKGQVTIPKRLREHLGLKAGSKVEFELESDGRVVLKSRRKAPKSRFAKVRGTMKSAMTTDEIMALTRGEE
jgi:AbrB family looped-hinge helix DNA binding protein